jgi:hypothetical protein
MAQYTLSTLNQAILKNIPEVGNYFNELEKFIKSDITKETATEYIQMCMSLMNQVENTKNVDEKSKQQMKKALTIIFSSLGTNECLKDIISNNNEKYQKLKEFTEELIKKYQGERNEYNELAKKYNENEKNKIIDLPGTTLSITRKNKNKRLTNDECIEIASSMNVDNLEEKFKRVSIKDIKSNTQSVNNISRIFAKKNDDSSTHVIQK